MAKDNSDNASWMVPLPEEFANKGMKVKTKRILASVTGVVLIGFALLIWSSYRADDEGLGTVPVIRADNSVVKEKPIEPGGREILHQDKEIFEIVDNSATDEDDNDVLAPSAEIPLKRPTPPEPVEENIEEETRAAETSVPTEEIIEKVEEKTPPAPAPAPKPVQKAVAAAPATKGNFMVQIGAFSKQSSAERAWADVKKKNMSVLGRLEPVYAASGSLFRVRGGMIATRAEADRICSALKKNNQNCMVVAK